MKESDNLDLLVQSRFKNLILWEAMAGRTATLCAELCGVSLGAYISLLNLRFNPFSTKDDLTERTYTQNARKIADFFKLPPEILFPESLYSLRLPHLVERRYASAEMLPLFAASQTPALLGNPEESVTQDEIKTAIQAACLTLKPREERILKLRFGLEDGHEYTLQEVATIFQVSKQRIRNIEVKALNKLRHPSRNETMKRLYDPENFCGYCGQQLVGRGYRGLEGDGICPTSNCRHNIEVNRDGKIADERSKRLSREHSRRVVQQTRTLNAVEP